MCWLLVCWKFDLEILMVRCWCYCYAYHEFGALAVQECIEDSSSGIVCKPWHQEKTGTGSLPVYMKCRHQDLLLFLELGLLS